MVTAADDVRIKVGLDADSAIKAWDSTANHIEESGKQLNQALIGGFVAASGAALGLAVKSVAKEGLEFNTSLFAAQRTFNLSREEASALGDEIINLAPKIGALPQELANVTLEAGKMGVALSDMTEFAGTLGKLASISDVPIENYTAQAGKITSVFQLNAEEFKKFGASVNRIDDEIGGSSYNITRFTARISATGLQAGLTAGEVAAFGAVFEKVGIPVERSGTAFETFIQTLTTIQSQTPEAQRAFSELFGEEALPFIQLMKDDAPTAINVFLAKLNTIPDSAERTRLLLQIFGKASSSELAALASRADLVSQALKLVKDDSGNLAKFEREFALQEDNPAFKLKQIQAQFQAVGIQLGLALLPPLNDVLEKILPITQAFADWVQANPDIAKVGVTIAAIGAIALPVVGILATASAALGSIGAISLPIAPILGLAGAVALVGINASKINTNSLTEDLKEKVGEGRQFASDLGRSMQLGLKENQSQYVGAGADLITGVMDGIDSLSSALWEKVRGVGSILASVKDKASAALGFEQNVQTEVKSNQQTVNFTYTPMYTIQVIDETAISARLKEYLDRELLDQINKAKLYQYRTAT